MQMFEMDSHVGVEVLGLSLMKVGFLGKCLSRKIWHLAQLFPLMP